jgi:hypothetical protein
VHESLAAEIGRVESANGPVEGDVDAFFGFGVGGFDDILCEQVQCTVDVLFAIFIP